MTIPSALELPKHVFFGPGIRERLFEVLDQKQYKRILFLTGQKWFKAAGWQQEFTQKLNGYTYDFISCRSGEPEIEGVNSIVQQAAQYKPQVIIGIGGGSVIDTAKACAALVKGKKRVEDFLEGIGKGKTLKKPGLPCIILPTTAGTGSEATKNAVIKSPQHNVKKSLRSSLLLPEYVIIDPEFTYKLDPLYTGITGMDALVQLFEAYVSRKAAPVPSKLIKTAFPLLFKGLRKLAEDINDTEARTDVAYGSFISGVALANSGLGAVHGFASSLGGLLDIPHGLVCAIFLQPVIDANQSVIREKMLELLKVHNKEKAEEALAQFKTDLKRLLSAFKLDQEFRKYDISRKLVPVIARQSTGSSMSGNPRDLTQEEREAIIRQALKN